MSATPPPVVGVAGAPEVATALREIGFTVVTGKTFRDAAIAIAAQLKQAPIHVVVEAMSEPGFTPWVLATHSKSLGIVLLPTSDAVDLTGQLGGVPQLPLPATVNELLVMIGSAPALAAAGSVVIGGHAAPAPVSTPAPAPAPAPAEVAQIDPFAAMLAQAVPADAPEAVAAPVPAPAPVVTDPFSAYSEEPTVTDPFAEPPSSTGPDSFDAMVASATVPPAPVGVVEALVPPLGTPNPVPEVAANATFDPFAATGITGDDTPLPEPSDSFLDVVAQHGAPAAELAPLPVVVEPVAQLMPPVPAVELPAEEYAAPFVAELPQFSDAEPVPATWAAEPAVPPAPAPPVAEPYIAPVPAVTDPHTAPAADPASSDFIQQLRARRNVRPVGQQPNPWAPATVSVAEPDLEFFRAPGISTGGCQVIISLAGKGGAGKTTQTLMYGQTAGAAGLRVLVIDANRDQGDIGTSLRVEKAGFPTVLASLNGSPVDAIVSKERINAARPAAAQDIAFDVVLAPPRELAGPRYASAQVYARLLDYAKTRYELVVIDTQIVEAQKSDLHVGFVIPELRSGAWSAGIALYDYSAIRNAFSVFDELAALGVTQQRTLVVATRWPEKESDAERFVSQFGQFGTFMGFVGDDPNINAQKSVGNLLIGSPAVAPVVRALLHRVTNNAAFAPIEETGRRGRKKDAPTPPKRERRGLFGGRR